MGTPTRQDINSTWLFDELTEEFSEDMTNSMAPSNPLVQPEAACAGLFHHKKKNRFCKMYLSV